MGIANELHDIVKERVMISHGAACFFDICEFGDSQVYRKIRRTSFSFLSSVSQSGLICYSYPLLMKHNGGVTCPVIFDPEPGWQGFTAAYSQGGSVAIAGSALTRG
jgi:hypothetical protein